MSQLYPVSVSPEILREFREELDEAHQEMENAAIDLERRPEDLAPLDGLLRNLEDLSVSATKLDLVPLSESLNDAIDALDKVRAWGTYPPPLSEFLLLFIDRVKLLAAEVAEAQVIDMRKTQHLLVSLQHLVLAPSPESLPERAAAAVQAITREIYEHAGEVSRETEVELFDDGGVELFDDGGVELFDESGAAEPRAGAEPTDGTPGGIPQPTLYVPRDTSPLHQAREFVHAHPQREAWLLLGQAADNATTHRGAHSEFVLYLTLAVNFLAGEPLDSEGLFLGICAHDLGLAPLAGVLGQGRPLDEETREAVRAHPRQGVAVVRALGGNETAECLVLHHHERLNGSGYPQGLKGEAISEAGRLMAIVDSFHAMIEERPHRRHSRSVLRAMAEINATAGSHYDPWWVGCFNRCIRNHWLAEAHATG